MGVDYRGISFCHCILWDDKYVLFFVTSKLERKLVEAEIKVKEREIMEVNIVQEDFELKIKKITPLATELLGVFSNHFNQHAKCISKIRE